MTTVQTAGGQRLQKRQHSQRRRKARQAAGGDLGDSRQRPSRQIVTARRSGQSHVQGAGWARAQGWQLPLARCASSAGPV